jgi:phosphoglycolate phosphatase
MPDTALTLRPEAAYDAVLLDLDGTLMDTIPDLAHAANAMRAELGLPALPEALIATFVGNGIDNLIGRTLAHDHAADALTAELIARARKAFYPAYHRINGTRSVLFDGVIEGLDAMRSAGLKIAVVTNKSAEFTLPLLELAGLSPYMDAVVCGDTLPERKPDPAPMLHACALLGVAPERSVAVGDSINDALSARAAGCAVLAVPYGYNHGHSVQTLDVDAIVDNIEVAARWILAEGRLPDQSNP